MKSNNNNYLKNVKIQGISLSAALLLSVSLFPFYKKPVAKVSKKNMERHVTAGISSVLASNLGIDNKGKVTSGVSSLIYFSKAVKRPVIIEKEKVDTVAKKYEDEFSDKVVILEGEFVNIRSDVAVNSSLIGKLRKGDIANFVETNGDWIKIKSGAVIGYVKKDLVAKGKKAKEILSQKGVSDIKGMSFAITIDEWKKQVEKVNKVAAEKKAKREEAKKNSAIKNRSANSEAINENNVGGDSYSITTGADPQTLMAAVIQCEAGNEVYEGQVAVGSVIMNRLRYGYSGSISGVIFQRGQFYSPNSKRLANVLKRGVKASCIKAAAEAMAGADMVGGRTQFRPVSSGKSGLVIGNHVFF